MVALQNGGTTDKPLNKTFDALPTTIFTVMTNLANEHGSVNLGQGFPDDEGPSSMKVSVLYLTDAEAAAFTYAFMSSNPARDF